MNLQPLSLPRYFFKDMLRHLNCKKKLCWRRISFQLYLGKSPNIFGSIDPEYILTGFLKIYGKLSLFKTDSTITISTNKCIVGIFFDHPYFHRFPSGKNKDQNPLDGNPGLTLKYAAVRVQAGFWSGIFFTV